MNAADVDKAIKGADAVISVIGRRKNSPKDMQTIAARNIVVAMQKYGVKRLVSLSGAVLRDGEQHAEVIKNSPLDWVIARGPMLNEGPYTGKYRVGWVGINTSARISRADVADFLLKQVTDSTYLHQLPMVSD